MQPPQGGAGRSGMIACVLCIVVWGAASQGAPADEAQWELATFAGSLSEASWCGGAVSGADGLMWSPVTEPEKFLPLPTRGVVLLRGKVHGVKELGFSISPATVLLDGVSVDVPSLFPHIVPLPTHPVLVCVALHAASLPLPWQLPVLAALRRNDRALQLSATATESVSLSPSTSLTSSISLTRSLTRSISLTRSLTRSATVTATATVTPTVTPSLGSSLSASISVSPSVSLSVSVTSSRSLTRSVTPSVAPSPESPTATSSISTGASASPSVSMTSSKSVSASASLTKSNTPSASTPASPSMTPTASEPPSVTPTISLTPSVTPTASLSVSITPTISDTPSVTPSASLSASVTPTISVSASITPTVSDTSSVTPTISITSTSTPTPSLCVCGCAQLACCNATEHAGMVAQCTAAAPANKHTGVIIIASVVSIGGVLLLGAAVVFIAWRIRENRRRERRDGGDGAGGHAESALLQSAGAVVPTHADGAEGEDSGDDDGETGGDDGSEGERCAVAPKAGGHSKHSVGRKAQLEKHQPTEPAAIEVVVAASAKSRPTVQPVSESELVPSPPRSPPPPQARGKTPTASPEPSQSGRSRSPGRRGKSRSPSPRQRQRSPTPNPRQPTPVAEESVPRDATPRASPAHEPAPVDGQRNGSPARTGSPARMGSPAPTASSMLGSRGNTPALSDNPALPHAAHTPAIEPEEKTADTPLTPAGPSPSSTPKPAGSPTKGRKLPVGPRSPSRGSKKPKSSLALFQHLVPAEGTRIDNVLDPAFLAALYECDEPLPPVSPPARSPSPKRPVSPRAQSPRVDDHPSIKALVREIMMHDANPPKKR